MDTYFFDSPAKALVKWCFLLITYFSSIILKQFSLAVVLPTVFIYLLSNLVDYIELAFMKQNKTRLIKNISFFIVLVLTATAIFVFSVYSNSNIKVNSFLEKNYFLVYIFCAVIWLIPLIDGIRGYLDQNKKASDKTAQDLQSAIAYDNMVQSIINLPKQ